MPQRIQALFDVLFACSATQSRTPLRVGGGILPEAGALKFFWQMDQCDIFAIKVQRSPLKFLSSFIVVRNSNTLATSCEELTHWKRPWYWEGLGPGGEGDDRGWDGWMTSLTQWAWVWVNSGSWWWTGRPGVLRFMGSQSWTWLSDWTELNWSLISYSSSDDMPKCCKALVCPIFRNATDMADSSVLWDFSPIFCQT